MNRAKNKQKVRAMDKLANQLMQRNLDTLLTNYDKSDEKSIMSLEEYARVIAQKGGVSFYVQIIKSVVVAYDNNNIENPDQTKTFADFIDHMKQLGNKKVMKGVEG